MDLYIFSNDVCGTMKSTSFNNVGLNVLLFDNFTFVFNTRIKLSGGSEFNFSTVGLLSNILVKLLNTCCKFSYCFSPVESLLPPSRVKISSNPKSLSLLSLSLLKSFRVSIILLPISLFIKKGDRFISGRVIGC